MALIIGATLLPLWGTAPAPAEIRWCLTCTPQWLADGLANILLFVPFGIAMQCSRCSVRRVALTGLGLSLLIESLQYAGMPPGRSPAIADVLANGLGAWVGATLGLHRCTLLAPNVAAARALAYGWTGVVIAVLWTTAWLLGDPAGQRAPAASVSIATSPFDYSPGYGWYGGRVERVAIRADTSTWYVQHSGSGPVVREIRGGSTDVSANAWVTRLDPAMNIRSLLYLHALGDSLPQLMIAQHGDNAVLISSRRASHWGLHSPRLTLPEVFAVVAGGAGPAQVQASVSSSRLALAVAGNGPAIPGLRQELALTPLLGWSLLQSVVPVQHRLASTVAFVWVLLLVLPLAYWGWLAGRAVCAGTLGVFVMALGIIPFVTGTHAILLRDLCMVLTVTVSGMLLAVLACQRRRDSPVRPNP